MWGLTLQDFYCFSKVSCALIKNTAKVELPVLYFRSHSNMLNFVLETFLNIINVKTIVLNIFVETQDFFDEYIVKNISIYFKQI